MAKSLIEELPRIASEGRRAAQKESCLSRY